MPMNRNATVIIAGVIAGLALLLFLTRRGTPFIYLSGIVAAIVLLYAWDWAPRPAAREVPARQPRPKAPPKDIYTRKVMEMSLGEAKRKAEPLIATTYDAVDGEPESLAELGPALQELFAKYPALKNRYGDSGFGAAGMRPFEPPARDVLRFNAETASSGRPYLRIGTDLDGNPILVQPMEDTVYILRRAGTDPSRKYLASYPSIYHWLLIEHPDYNA